MPTDDITLGEIERRMQRLEKTVSEIDIERERVMLSLSELALSTKATLAVNDSQLKSLEAASTEQKKQNKYLFAILAMLVLQAGPDFVTKVVKFAVETHLGITL